MSLSFRWTAQQVAKLGKNKNTIYIMAGDRLSIAETAVSIRHISFDL